MLRLIRIHEVDTRSVYAIILQLVPQLGMRLTSGVAATAFQINWPRMLHDLRSLWETVSPASFGWPGRRIALMPRRTAADRRDRPPKSDEYPLAEINGTCAGHACPTHSP